MLSLPLSWWERGLEGEVGGTHTECATPLHLCSGVRAQIVEHLAVYAGVGGVMQQPLFHRSSHARCRPRHCLWRGG